MSLRTFNLQPTTPSPKQKWGGGKCLFFCEIKNPFHPTLNSFSSFCCLCSLRRSCLKTQKSTYGYALPTLLPLCRVCRFTHFTAALLGCRHFTGSTLPSLLLLSCCSLPLSALFTRFTECCGRAEYRGFPTGAHTLLPLY